jgi:hypothetical protein
MACAAAVVLPAGSAQAEVAAGAACTHGPVTAYMDLYILQYNNYVGSGYTDGSNCVTATLEVSFVMIGGTDGVCRPLPLPGARVTCVDAVGYALPGNVLAVYEFQGIGTNGLPTAVGESAWDPRVLLTLETRMEHGKHRRAAEAAEVPRRAA